VQAHDAADGRPRRAAADRHARSRGDERGLFVTLGPYSKDAQHIERTRQDLRLVNGTELVDLVFAHYERLSPEYKRLLPMRSVYVVDGTAADS
jgi:restriction system protein